MNKRDVVEYVVIMVSEFARRHLLSVVQAYRYLRLHKGIDFLEQNYEIAHTLPMQDVVADLATYCRRNGGGIA